MFDVGHECQEACSLDRLREVSLPSSSEAGSSTIHDTSVRIDERAQPGDVLKINMIKGHVFSLLFLFH